MRLDNSIGLSSGFYCEMVRYIHIEKPKPSFEQQFTLAYWEKSFDYDSRFVSPPLETRIKPWFGPNLLT